MKIRRLAAEPGYAEAAGGLVRPTEVEKRHSARQSGSVTSRLSTSHRAQFAGGVCSDGPYPAELNQGCREAKQAS